MSIYRIIADAVLLYLARARDEDLRFKKRMEEEMANVKAQIERLRQQLKEMTDVHVAYRELFTKYTALVKEAGEDKAALEELTNEFESQIDDIQKDVGEGTDTPFDPSANVGGEEKGGKAKKGK